MSGLTPVKRTSSRAFTAYVPNTESIAHTQLYLTIYQNEKKHSFWLIDHWSFVQIHKQRRRKKNKQHERWSDDKKTNMFYDENICKDKIARRKHNYTVHKIISRISINSLCDGAEEAC